MSISLSTFRMWAMVGLLAMATGCAAQPAAKPASFEQGYFLEQHEKDYASAAEAYEQFAASEEAESPLRQEACRRAAGCREELICRDMARLMPPEAIAYVELRRPGQLLVDMAEMMGVTAKPIQDLLLARSPDPDWPMPFVIPEELAISPELFDALSRFGGLAVAVTSFDPHHGPDMVLVLNASECELIHGLVETAAQFAPPGEPIEGCPTLVFPEGVVLAMGQRVVIVGRPAELVEQTVARLKGKGDDGLLGNETFAALSARREQATLFGFVDAQAALKIAGKQLPRDARRQLNTMRAILDLDHLRGASLALGVIDQAVGMEFAVSLDEEHNNLMYNLIRTPPLTGKTFAAVPAGSAMIVAFGMNPTGSEEEVRAQAEARAIALRPITGMDIGREIFSNIEEICLYVIPPSVQPDAPRPKRQLPIPDLAMVIAAKHPERSQALWSEIFSIVAMASGEEPGTECYEQIGQTLVQIHPMPKIGQLYSAQMDGTFVLGTSMAAIQASIAAGESTENVRSDSGLASALDWISEDSSVAVIAHVGRLTELAKQFAPGAAQQPIAMASQILRQTVVCLAVDESQTRLGLRAGVMGLPQADEVLPMARAMLAQQMRSPPPPPPPPPPQEPEQAPAHPDQSD